jgi:lysophospholipase L1-like esterase
MPGAELLRTGVFVSAVETVSRDAQRTLVTLGDSITEGFGSTINEFRGWSDVLAQRLHANRRTRNWSVADAGINSNRLLHDSPGTNALARFDRDVLSIPGVKAVILLEGINDIGYSHTHPEEAVTAAEIIAAYRQLIARAHAHGIALFGATLTPFSQSHYYDSAGESSRQAVNAWIRNSGAFDGVVDFDAALRDPANPNAVREDLQGGDHLHPNDAGYRIMANCVRLDLLARLL